MPSRNDIENWLKAGAEISSGLRLFSLSGGDPRFGRIVTAFPRYKYLLVAFLCDKAGLPVPQPQSFQSDTPVSVPLREDWPFLSEADCPPELKILIADKISCYHRYCTAHARLFDCLTLGECFETAREVVDNYLENRLIFEELHYYKEHHTVLGRHPVFERMKNLDRLRRMSIVDLIHSKERLEHNIWRIRSEMSKGDKPHLQGVRESRLREKYVQLAEIHRLIETYQS